MTDIIIPLCDCHGVEKIWRKDERRKSGGSWYCRIRNRQTQKKYSKTEAGKIVRKRKIAKYLATEKGAASERKKNSKYRNSIKGYLKKREWELRGQREKVATELEDIHKQRKELEVVIARLK